MLRPSVSMDALYSSFTEMPRFSKSAICWRASAASSASFAYCSFPSWKPNAPIRWRPAASRNCCWMSAASPPPIPTLICWSSEEMPSAALSMGPEDNRANCSRSSPSAARSFSTPVACASIELTTAPPLAMRASTDALRKACESVRLEFSALSAAMRLLTSSTLSAN